ncbi:amidophosphoribosyltransferase [Candidatus Gracilibacteria bacterium]|nr:amidophosphoribosyltransferase [Candidatus Gracilibacteria bacterium]
MCGIIGISKRKDSCFTEIYDGLLMLQHRGQDAAGIVTFDDEFFYEKKNSGLIKDVFKYADIQELKGKVGLGHVRYPTAGSLNAKEAQPFFVNAPFGIYLVHNGNLTNTNDLREKIQKTYCRHLRTKSDSEILLNVFADQIYKVQKENPELDDIKTIFKATKQTMHRVQGAYSIISIIDKVGLFAFRDKAGIRPLVLGKRSTVFGNEWIFSSEDVSLKALGFEKVRDVKPGEAILITPKGEMISKLCVNGKLRPCIFEYVYLARPDSMLDEVSVYKTQLRLGIALSKQIKAANLKIDSIMPVPDSARPVALEIAQTLGIKYREGLVKNRYIGRTFIMPGQNERKKCVRRKLNTIDLEFKNRNILLVDDSIVRGNTMKQIVKMCRKAGAKNIFVASAAPPLKHICVYGVDMPSKKEFVANGLSIKEIKKVLGVDELFYQKIEDLVDSANFNKDIDKFCTGCFNGKYVTEEVTPAYLEEVETKGRGTQNITEIQLLNI